MTLFGEMKNRHWAGKCLAISADYLRFFIRQIQLFFLKGPIHVYFRQIDIIFLDTIKSYETNNISLI